MSSKRKAIVDAVPPQEPKRRQSKGAKVAEPRGGKRKIEGDEEEETKPAKKAPAKRSSTPKEESSRRTSTAGPAASPAIKPKKTKPTKVNVEAEGDGDEEEDAVMEEEALVEEA